MEQKPDEKALSVAVIASPQRLEGYHDGITEVYTSNGWGSAYDQEMIKQMFGGGYYLVAISSQGVAGFLRAFTDGVCVTHLSEVAVHPKHQRKGIANLLLTRFMQDLAHTTIYAETMDAPSETLMSKHGFKYRPQLKVYARKKDGAS